MMEGKCVNNNLIFLFFQARIASFFNHAEMTSKLGSSVASNGNDRDYTSLVHSLSLLNSATIDYWWVDLQKNYHVAFALIYHRSGQIGRFRNVRFYLSYQRPSSLQRNSQLNLDYNYLCDQRSNDAPWTSLQTDITVYNSSCRGTGRYFIIRMDGDNGGNQFLEFVEAEVFVTAER